MAGFAIRTRFASHPDHSAKTCHALRLQPDHSIGAGHFFVDAIEALFDDKRLIGGLKGQHENTVHDILNEALESGIISMKSGQYTAEYRHWEDVVAKCNKLKAILNRFGTLGAPFTQRAG